MPEEAEGGGTPPSIDDFLGEPSRRLTDWRWLWEGDHRFPIRSHRGVLGRLLVAVKRLFRPLVTVPQNDLWERQRTFNLILLERLQQLEELRHEERVAQLEDALPERTREMLRHNDALFARLDQKVDLYRRQAGELSERLGAALATAEASPDAAPDPGPALRRAFEERGYLELERRYRGTEDEIRERLTLYAERLKDRGEVLDLGCGRGEALQLLADLGLSAKGVDSSGAMVAQCRERGLRADEGDLFEVLAGQQEGSLGGVVSFHVIEHLPATSLDRLVRLAWRALAPGGVLILETPNPLSILVAARSFWLDPTHLRPVHPESLALSCRLAGFDPVERLDLRPYPKSQRLPELRVGELPEDQRHLAAELNALRDRLDDLLFGHQDYALVAEKPR